MDSSNEEGQTLNYTTIATHKLCAHTHELAVKRWSPMQLSGVLASAGIEIAADTRRGESKFKSYTYKKIATQSKLASYKLLLHSQ